MPPSSHARSLHDALPIWVPGAPALISLDDAETLFHEFGHALHAIVQDITYPGLATTPRDFVEFPSQVNEHWVLTREVLDRFARSEEHTSELQSPCNLVCRPAATLVPYTTLFRSGFPARRR